MKKHYINITISDDNCHERLDKWLNSQLANVSRKQIQNAIEQQEILVNGLATNQKQVLSAGDIISGSISSKQESTVVAQPIKLNIIFEDHDLLVINKPAGLVTHPGHGNPDSTLLNGILHHATDNKNLPKNGLIHRLDKDTSGLLICAKTPTAYQKLVAMMHDRLISREYDALCWHQPTKTHDTIATNIGRHPTQRTKMSVLSVGGRSAITHYELKAVYLLGCLIRFRLETGRTHQIRVHASYAGFPIIGDTTYTSKQWKRNVRKQSLKSLEVPSISRQALHAQTLKFEHPITGKSLSFSVDWPEDMVNLKNALEQHDN